MKRLFPPDDFFSPQLIPKLCYDIRSVQAWITVKILIRPPIAVQFRGGKFESRFNFERVKFESRFYEDRETLIIIYGDRSFCRRRLLNSCTRDSPDDRSSCRTPSTWAGTRSWRSRCCRGHRCPAPRACCTCPPWPWTRTPCWSSWATPSWPGRRWTLRCAIPSWGTPTKRTVIILGKIYL